MSQVHVMPDGDGWRVRSREGHGLVSRWFEQVDDALAYARGLASARNAELVVSIESSDDDAQVSRPAPSGCPSAPR